MNAVVKASDMLHQFTEKQFLHTDHCLHADHRLPQVILNLLDHIHKHLFDSDLNVKTAMRRCGVRDNNVTSNFRLFLGVGMRKYIESLRMEAARQLLEKSDLAAIDIATCIGFEHPQSFYRTFNRAFGCTPTSYRQRKHWVETLQDSQDPMHDLRDAYKPRKHQNICTEEVRPFTPRPDIES